MENEKCPVCQKGKLGSSNDGLKIECSQCWFRCHVGHLPRIAAAMELARAEYDLAVTTSKTDSPDEIAKAMTAVCIARKRVLEIFGGE